jgi:hypothetical protein
MLVAGVVLCTASFFLVPQAIQGMTTPNLPADEPPESPALRTTYDAVRALMAKSHAIVAVHTNEQSGLTEVVVWHRDTDIDGAIDPSELVVLTHSRFLGQVSASVLEWQPSLGDPNYARLSAPIPIESARSPGFLQMWRSREGVGTSPIAIGVERFGLERLGRRFGEKVWCVELRWSADVSDAYEDRSSAFVVAPENYR